jgi:hypothetical protein
MARSRFVTGMTPPGLAELGHEVLLLAADPNSEQAVIADGSPDKSGSTGFNKILDLANKQLLIHYDTADTLNIVIPYYPVKADVPLDIKGAEELLGVVTIMGCGD